MYFHSRSINVIIPMLGPIVYKLIMVLIALNKLPNLMLEVNFFSLVEFSILRFSFPVKPKVEAAKPANEQSAVIGQDIQMSWKFSGIEKPHVTWLFNGQPLPTSERFQITETEDGTSTLSIRNAEL